MLGFLFFPITGPFNGLMFIARRIAEQAETAYYDEGGIRAALLELEMRLQDGDISEEEYARAEEPLMERLSTAMRRKAGLG